LAQVLGQIPDPPVHTYGAHEGFPEPATFVHVPFADAPSACAHTLHEPPHAPSQQYPSTQLPLWHWFEAVHAVPVTSFGTQLLEVLQ
jgi:hypothetical protein